MESLTSKVDFVYLNAKRLNWTYEPLEKNVQLNSILKFTLKENLEQIDNKGYKIVDINKISKYKNNTEEEFITFIEDYELLARIYHYYVSKVESTY